MGTCAVAFVYLALASLAIGCSSSSAADAGSSGEQCVGVDAGSSCMGRSVTFCSTLPADSSSCTNAHYQVGSLTIPCQSCSATDIEACGEQATMACLLDGGSMASDAAAGSDAATD
jgi:hypothetical protein